MRRHRPSLTLLAAAIAVIALSPARARGGGGRSTAVVNATYLYPLASPSGPLDTSAAALAVDEKHNEVYVVHDGLVSVFNPSGMEVYVWPQDEAVGPVYSVAPLEDGDVLAVRWKESRRSVVRCNYRGEPKEQTGLPGLELAEAQGFQASNVVARGGKLYAADLGQARLVLVLDLATGAVERRIELVQTLGFEEKQADYAVDSLNVDADGNILVTVAPAFRVYIIPPAGPTRNFGKSGSAPGKFGIIRGAATDPQGHFFVSDALKSAVMVFDRDFGFLGEFGYRGNHPGNLRSPRDVVFLNGRLYVSQQAKRGVAVFQIAFPP